MADFLSVEAAGHVKNPEPPYATRRMGGRWEWPTTLVEGHRVNHVLHLLLSLCTFGLWIIVWVSLAVMGGEKRELFQVDAYGVVTRRKV